ncbi:VANGL1 [Cordylochernes scorpioides]|uniref:Vang-like protein n=1 Tax=Cordylochernes scorpioides TaxID=51811 RepID=A0ABY6KAK9_9ARAC|nr:VANGL1 [Cordylochernes scorpioides]
MSLWTGDIHLPPYKPSATDADSVYSEQSRRTAGRKPRDEVIEVQILSQDDNWGENTTAVSASDGPSGEDISSGGPAKQSLAFRCQMWVGPGVAGVLCAASILSPVAMAALPRVGLLEWPRLQRCGPECDGLLIGLAFKLIVLAASSWALFFRRPRTSLPRIFILRALLMVLLFVFIFSYWLFYVVRVVERRLDELSYHSIVLFAVSLADSLLFIYFLAVVVLEVRHLEKQYFVKVVRSPDGESRCYNMGELSIQRAAAWVLERYYRDFSIYNPYLETLPSRHRRHNNKAPGYKVYEVDGVPPTANGHPPSRAPSTRAGDSHNERFYEEHEYERRVQKRRARLVTAAEEAFTHIKRLQGEQGPAIPLDPTEAAQAIFPSMARALQKFLRLTRQQPRHTMQSIVEHLATCLSHGLSPRAFLEKFLVARPVLQNDKELQPGLQTWALVCDTLVSRPVTPGCLFLLRQHDVSLLVTVHRLPHLNITEEVADPGSGKFVLRLNSETSV